MHLSYNGVELKLLELNRVERENVYTPDGTDLLYIKWRLIATCVFGGFNTFRTDMPATATQNVSDATATELYTPPGGLRGFSPPFRGSAPNLDPVDQAEPNSGAPFDAAISDAEFRLRLMLPRGQLAIYTYDRTGKQIFWFVSPAAGYAIDPANGPHPISLDVIESVGDGMTFGVNYQIETAVLPVPSGSDQAILSHRWEMTHDHDDDYYMTRVIRGEVVFNAAKLDALGLNPDWFRSQFFHPIPLGHRRKLGPIVQSSDGLVLRYEIYDTDTSITFDAGDSGATRMDIVENLKYTIPWNLTSSPR